MTTGIQIGSIASHILLNALEVADSVATSTGRSDGGWIRLAKVQGTAEEPYVIAVRRVKTERAVQFSCSCPDYRFRQSKRPGAICKHQRLFFEQCGNTPKRFWFYKAGHSFCVSALSQIVASFAALPLAKHTADEKAA